MLKDLCPGITINRYLGDDSELTTKARPGKRMREHTIALAARRNSTLNSTGDDNNNGEVIVTALVRDNGFQGTGSKPELSVRDAVDFMGTKSNELSLTYSTNSEKRRLRLEQALSNAIPGSQMAQATRRNPSEMAIDAIIMGPTYLEERGQDLLKVIEKVHTTVLPDGTKAKVRYSALGDNTITLTTPPLQLNEGGEDKYREALTLQRKNALMALMGTQVQEVATVSQ